MAVPVLSSGWVLGMFEGHSTKSTGWIGCVGQERKGGGAKGGFQGSCWATEEWSCCLQKCGCLGRGWAQGRIAGLRFHCLVFGKASRQLNGGETRTRDASVGATSRQITFKATSLGESSQGEWR